MISLKRRANPLTFMAFFAQDRRKNQTENFVKIVSKSLYRETKRACEPTLSNGDGDKAIGDTSLRHTERLMDNGLQAVTIHSIDIQMKRLVCPILQI